MAEEAVNPRGEPTSTIFLNDTLPNCLLNTYPNIYRLLQFSPCVKGSFFCNRQRLIQSPGQSAETGMGCPSIIIPTPKAWKASQKRGRRNGAGRTRRSAESRQKCLTHLSTANQLQLPTQDTHEVMPAKFQHGQRILNWRTVLYYWCVSNTREVGRSEPYTAISKLLT